MRGAMIVATNSSFRLKPHKAKILTTPTMNTFSALPMVKPPPIKEADRVAKTTHEPNSRPATEKCSSLVTPRPAHRPTTKTANRLATRTT